MRGDVKKYLGVNGSDIRLVDGFATTDTGPMNAILYSLFATDWVGNLFVTGNQVLQSDFQTLHDQTATLDVLLNIAKSAENSLQWMLEQNIFKDISAATRVLDGNMFVTELEITDNAGVVKRLEVRKYAMYWEIVGTI